MSFYGQWYRRKETGELKKANDNKKRALEIINETASKITKKVEAIQYPRYKYNYDLIPEKVEGIVILEKENNSKINLLFIMPWMITGGADLFNLNLIKGLNKENGVIIPIQNVKNLTLSDEVLEAIENGDFHIYPISTVDEGIELLTGVEAGEMDENGNYKENTINYLVQEKLKKYAKKSLEFSKE